MSAPENFTVQLVIRLALFALFGSAVAAWTKYKNRWRSNSSRGWPVSTATIHSGMVQAVPQSTRYRCELSYSYFVDGYRSGTYERIFNNEDAAYHFARRMKGHQLTARYKGSKPDASVLEEDAISRVEQDAILNEMCTDAPLVQN